MVQNKGKRKLITALAVLVLLLIIIGAIAWIKVASQNKADPYAAKNPTSTTNESADDSSKDVKQETDLANPETNTDTGNTSTDPALDPATVSTVDIAPMTITVSYVKGAGSF